MTVADYVLLWKGGLWGYRLVASSAVLPSIAGRPAAYVWHN